MRMRERMCPVCQQLTQTLVWADAHFDLEKLSQFSFASRKKPEFMHFRLVRCVRCNLLFTNPAPAVDWLHNHYHAALFDASSESQLAAHAYARHIPARIQPSDSSAALDIGSGDGAFLEQLLALGFKNLLGIEPSHAPIAQASPKIRPYLREGMFTGNEVPPASQSLITCFQTLEHVDKPAELCKKAFQLLRPSGALYIVAHNYQALPARILGTQSPIFDIEHLQLFDRKSLLTLFQSVGFESVEIKPFCNDYPLSYWLRLFPLPESVKQHLLRSLKFLGLANRCVALCPGNLSVIGYKPL